MSKVGALIKKIGLSILNTEPNGLSILNTEISPNHTKKQDFSQKEYRLDSPDNLYSTLEHELDMLFYKFNYLRTKGMQKQLNLDDLSKEDLCFINSCRVIFEEGFYHEYTMIKAEKKGMHVNPPQKYIVYNEDGSIDTMRSERMRAFVRWVNTCNGFRVECPFPLYTIKQLALINPFFSKIDDSELNCILLNLLRERKILP